jgi:hypothetical protein
MASSARDDRRRRKAIADQAKQARPGGEACPDPVYELRITGHHRGAFNIEEQGAAHKGATFCNPARRIGHVIVKLAWIVMRKRVARAHAFGSVTRDIP